MNPSEVNPPHSLHGLQPGDTARATGGVASAPAVAAALTATLWAAWLYGLRVLYPGSVDWLLHGDAAAHHVGVQFFLRDAWHWPLGLFYGFGEVPTSVVFTDGIPALALLAKAATHMGLWPQGWQYFGLWMLACHAAAAWWGVRLLQALAARQGGAPLHPMALWAGGLFFTVSPALMMRAYGHEALMAHALLLVALAWAVQPRAWRAWPWLGLVALAVGTHAYLALMAALIGVAAAISALLSGQVSGPRLLLQAVACAAVLSIWAWALGYFAGAAEVSTHGHGLYSANVLTWVDPMPWVDFMNLHQRQAPYVAEWSRVWPAQAQATGGQYEGYAWLGSGMLAVLALAASLALAQPLFRLQRGGMSAPLQPLVSPGRWGHQGPVLPAWPAWPVWAVCGFFALWAISARVTLGAHTLLAFDPPPALAAVLGVFRASGRFIWPLTYLLMAWALVRVARLGAPMVLLPAALLLQAVDTSPKWFEFHSRFRMGPPGIAPAVQDPRWSAWLSRCPRLEWVADEAPDQPAGRWIGPSLAAGIAGAQVLPAPTSHPSAQAREQRRQHLQALQAGAWRSDTVYVFPGLDPTVPADLLSPWPLQVLDGHLTLAAPGCQATASSPPEATTLPGG